MSSTEFIVNAKKIVRDYIFEHLDKSDLIPPFDVYVVWSCYILGNFKALISSTSNDGMYYEITYNAVKDEYYFDAYKKSENRCISGVELLPGF